MLSSRLHRVNRFHLLASSLVFEERPLTLAPSEWQRLPMEIAENIFDIFINDIWDSPMPYLNSRLKLQSALRTLACVCRHWYIMATEILYEDIYVASLAALGLLAEALTDGNNKHLPPLVRTLIMGADIFKNLHKAGQIAQIDHGERIRNYEKICEVCPNLTFVHQLRGRDYVGDIIDVNHIDISKLTHLEVSLGGDMACIDDVKPSFLGSIEELPAVQELMIRGSADGLGCDMPSPEICTIRLPAMPLLRRLSIVNWVAKNCELLDRNLSIFPTLRVQEYINCSLDYLHHLLVSREVERLVITGSMHSPYPHASLETSPLFRGYHALTHLCIPFSIFRSCSMPINLRYLLLIGTVDENELVDVENELVSFFTAKSQFSTYSDFTYFAKKFQMAFLQHVHVASSLVARKDESTFARHEWQDAAEAARDAKVAFTVGIEDIEGHKTNEDDEHWPNLEDYY